MASFLDFLGQLASTGLPIAGGIAQGTSQGIQKRAELDRLRQEMALRQSAEERNQARHPFELQGLQQETAADTPALRANVGESLDLAAGDVPRAGGRFLLGLAQRSRLARFREEARALGGRTKREWDAIKYDAHLSQQEKNRITGLKKAYLALIANPMISPEDAEKADEEITNLDTYMRYLELEKAGPAGDAVRGVAEAQRKAGGFTPREVVPGLRAAHRLTGNLVNPATGEPFTKLEWDLLSPDQQANAEEGKPLGPRVPTRK
jgi:hypothetical protein